MIVYLIENNDNYKGNREDAKHLIILIGIV